MNALFFIGNKRSGTTHLSRLLNLHPNIYISNESDILWILYQYQKGNHFENYPGDSPRGMLTSLRKAGHILSRNRSIRDNFISFQKELMRTGLMTQGPMEKANLAYIGDKKPFQQADPELVPFLLEHFPNSKFIHLYRHPFDVIRSAQQFLNKTGGYIWGALNEREIFEEWVRHEQNVLRMRTNCELEIIDIRYKELIACTEAAMAKIYRFLDLEYRDDLLRKSRLITAPNFRMKRNYTIPTGRAEQLMNRLGLKRSFSLIERRVYPRLDTLKTKADIILKRMRKKLEAV